MQVNRTVFAHRGLCKKAPENTMAAFEKAVAKGVRWIETDVDILGDGTPVLIHDSSLDRTTNLQGSYYELSAADLPRIDAGWWFSPKFAGEPLPTLRMLVDYMNQTGLNANIEVKANEAGRAMTSQLVDSVVAELERLEAGREVIISSFSPLVLELFRDRAPKLERGALFTSGSLFGDWRSILEITESTYIHPEDSGLTKQHIQYARSFGYGVNVWTVDSNARANELFNWGATGIFTNVADKMVHLEAVAL
ncbi:MAG: glycerophosphodiester phosphodiesterase family protein [Arcanobacterium sp.]|nr:glycerophosphodiester phosphodiesterase family protein [Arcanobacterium sp.]